MDMSVRDLCQHFGWARGWICDPFQLFLILTSKEVGFLFITIIIYQFQLNAVLSGYRESCFSYISSCSEKVTLYNSYILNFLFHSENTVISAVRHSSWLLNQLLMVLDDGWLAEKTVRRAEILPFWGLAAVQHLICCYFFLLGYMLCSHTLHQLVWEHRASSCRFTAINSRDLW